jgi:hypothetical protein
MVRAWLNSAAQWSGVRMRADCSTAPSGAPPSSSSS